VRNSSLIYSAWSISSASFPPRLSPLRELLLCTLVDNQQRTCVIGLGAEARMIL